MNDDVPNLRGGRLTTAGFILGPVVAVGAMVAGLVWQAARYPTRVEFDSLREGVVQIRVDQAVMSRDMREQSRQGDRIEKKVEQLAESAGRKRREQ